MNKQEALQKIKELEEYIEECDKLPEIKRGQLYKHECGDFYVVAHPQIGVARNSEFNLMGLNGSSWSDDNGFGHSKHQFTYIGIAKDHISVDY